MPSFSSSVAFMKQIQCEDYREYLLDRTAGEWGIDESKRVEAAEPAASFRKLNVD